MKETLVMTEAKRQLFGNHRARKANQIMKATLVMTTEAKIQTLKEGQAKLSTTLFQT